MSSTNDSRKAAVEAATAYDGSAMASAQVVAGAMIAKALIYVGDRIGEIDFEPDERVAVELGGIGQAISDLSSP